MDKQRGGICPALSVELQHWMIVEFLIAALAIKVKGVREPTCTNKMMGLRDCPLQMQAVTEEYSQMEDTDDPGAHSSLQMLTRRVPPNHSILNHPSEQRSLHLTSGCRKYGRQSSKLNDKMKKQPTNSKCGQF